MVCTHQKVSKVLSGSGGHGKQVNCKPCFVGQDPWARKTQNRHAHLWMYKQKYAHYCITCLGGKGKGSPLPQDCLTHVVFGLCVDSSLFDKGAECGGRNHAL